MQTISSFQCSENVPHWNEAHSDQRKRGSHICPMESEICLHVKDVGDCTAADFLISADAFSLN